MHHKSWIVQISCLKKRRRSELEQLLSIFDQSNRTSDNHILNVREEDFPEKYRPIIRRLKGAASDSTVKKQMKEEDEIFKYLRDAARIEANKLLKEKDKVLEEKDKTIEEKDKKIEENKKELEEKDRLLEVMQEEIERLKANVKNG